MSPSRQQSLSTESKSAQRERFLRGMARLNRYRWLLALATLVFVADQITKAWIHHTLPLGTYFPPDHIAVIPGFFHIVHVSNTGAAWGMFQGMSFWLGLLAVAALAAIFRFRRHLCLDLLPVQISFGLLCGGILGNLVDRMLHGHVIDFLDFHFGSFVWPAFNVADAGICVGVGIYVAYSFLHPEALEKPRDKTKD